MRRRNLAAWIVLGLAILLGFIGRSAESNALYFLSGVGFLTAVALWISLAAWWDGLRGRIPVFPGLFPRLHGAGWDPVEGAPVRWSRKAGRK